MFDMRLRIPELMAKRGFKTAYQLHYASGQRISMTNAYHLVEKRGDIERVSMDTLEALCIAFGVDDPGLLLAREPAEGEPKPRKRARKR